MWRCIYVFIAPVTSALSKCPRLLRLRLLRLRLLRLLRLRRPHQNFCTPQPLCPSTPVIKNFYPSCPLHTPFLSLNIGSRNFYPSTPVIEIFVTQHPSSKIFIPRVHCIPRFYPSISAVEIFKKLFTKNRLNTRHQKFLSLVSTAYRQSKFLSLNTGSRNFYPSTSVIENFQNLFTKNRLNISTLNFLRKFHVLVIFVKSLILKDF